jgi:hypothetical protein
VLAFAADAVLVQNVGDTSIQSAKLLPLLGSEPALDHAKLVLAMKHLVAGNHQISSALKRSTIADASLGLTEASSWP